MLTQKELYIQQINIILFENLIDSEFIKFLQIQNQMAQQMIRLINLQIQLQIHRFRLQLQLKEDLFIKIRGVYSGSKVAPNLLIRVVSQCRNVLMMIYLMFGFILIYKNHKKELNFRIDIDRNSLFISCDCEYSNEFNNPEKVGETATMRLLDEIKNIGYFDNTQQQYALLLMAISQRKVSQIKLGRISTQIIETLKIIGTILGVTLNIDDSVFSCIGCRLINLSRLTQ
ncbi:unnamed protein product [Paramecium pentaurelia]|uniref:Uncharacterized protein n=1 Tax=Paramecium pentaurelia TaxID=43138 RepID=A0A8S1TC32_9CILI|nr:unnamed protein product [Paramecium pentaurelia]